jgi:hypothetical protein
MPDDSIPISYLKEMEDKLMTLSEAILLGKLPHLADRTVEKLRPHAARLYDGPGYMCPANCGKCSVHLWAAIVHLDDEHHWTRERIAEWTAQFNPLENKPAAATENKELDLTRHACA